MAKCTQLTSLAFKGLTRQSKQLVIVGVREAFTPSGCILQGLPF